MTSVNTNYLKLAALSSALFIGCSSQSVAEVYPAGTISIKPININFVTILFDQRHPDSKIYTDARNRQGVVIPHLWKDDDYKTQFSAGFGESDRNGYGYGIELGYVLGWNTEVLLRAGVSRENGINQRRVGERALDFHDRNSYGVSIGGRHYYDVDPSWRPFVGAVAGLTVQGATKAKVTGHRSAVAGVGAPGPFIGNFTMLKQKTLFNAELHAGTDYLFNETWGMSVSVGVRYGERGGKKTTVIPTASPPTNPANVPRAITYTDNRDQWTFPVTVSLKIVL